MAEVVESSPGRLDMMGGVGDYSGGLVLEVATHVTTTVRARIVPEGGDVVTMRSEAFGSCSVPFAPLRATAPADIPLKSIQQFLKSMDVPSWAFYVYGSLAAFSKSTGWLPAAPCCLDLFVHSTVPASQGVSSSASVECATLKVLRTLSGVDISNLQLAHVGQLAENFVVGAPCGLMDQLSSLLGHPEQVLPIVCRPDVCYPPIPLPPSVALLGWPSGVKHDVGGSPYLSARTATYMGKKIAESILKRAFAHATDIPLAVFQLDVLPLLPHAISGAEFRAKYGDVDDALSRIVDAEVYNPADCLRFPIEESSRCRVVLSLLKALQRTPVSDATAHADMLTQIGELMYQTHNGYNSIGLGSPETDSIIRALHSVGVNGGIFGARISGGGSGGTVAVLCEKSAIPALESLAASLTFGVPFTALIQ